MPSALIAIALIALKAAAIVMLARIAVIDLRTRKIRNADLIRLLAVALALFGLEYARTANWAQALAVAGMAAILFVILLALWLMKKLGAGDVKLLAMVPLLVGFNGSLPFVYALLGLSLLTYLVVKFPRLVPERWFRAYIEPIGKSGRVPFGVPIALAATIGILVAAITPS